MLDPRFVFLGAAIHAVGSTRYIAQTVRGRVVPHRLSWLLWSIAPLIAFVAELSKGVGVRSLMTLLAGLVPLAILITSFWTRGSWKLGRFDLVCAALSVVGLVLWRITGEGNVAIAMSLAADAFAVLPIIRKTILAPETESYAVYLTASINAGITLLTIDRWTFATAAWPIYIFTAGTTLVPLIAFGRRRSPAQLSNATSSARDGASTRGGATST